MQKAARNEPVSNSLNEYTKLKLEMDCFLTHAADMSQPKVLIDFGLPQVCTIHILRCKKIEFQSTERMKRRRANQLVRFTKCYGCLLNNYTMPVHFAKLPLLRPTNELFFIKISNNIILHSVLQTTQLEITIKGKSSGVLLATV